MRNIISLFLTVLSIIRGDLVGFNNVVQASTMHSEIVYNRKMINNENNGQPAAEPPPDLPNNAKGQNTYLGDTVVTTHGQVRGYQIKETKVWEYLDIPYAKFDPRYPFQTPTKPDSWTGVRKITEHSSLCPQLDSTGSYTGTHDCLTLSVFVPQGVKNADVLFHIHDGDFIGGSGDPRIYGPGFLVPKQVILILPNYRVGPLGFLCMQNIIAPGNAALKDLTMALNWTRENIEAFGGNSFNIVVSGTGTGAAITQYLAMAPKSQDFFSKVIIESGSVLSYWAIDRTPLETANELVKRLNNPEGEVSKLSNVFNNTSLERIIKAAKGLVFRPCVEGDFITKTPWNFLNDQKLNKSFMLGATDRPGLQKAMQHTKESVAELDKNFALLLPNDLHFDQQTEKKEIGKKVKYQYFGNETITLNLRNELSLYLTDYSYLSPSIRNARLLLTADSTVYLYEFSFVSNTGDSKSNDIHGAAKGDSLKYVFQRKEYEPLEGTEEYKIINLMTNLWISFMKTGKPTSEGIKWEEFAKTNESLETWLSIDSKTEEKKGFHQDRLRLWTEIYNEHFIDNSLAHQTRPCIFSASFLLLVYFLKPLHSIDDNMA